MPETWYIVVILRMKKQRSYHIIEHLLNARESAKILYVYIFTHTQSYGLILIYFCYILSIQFLNLDKKNLDSERLRKKRKKERYFYYWAHFLWSNWGRQWYITLNSNRFNPDSLNTQKHHPFQCEMGAINAKARTASVNQDGPRYTRIYSH